MNTNENDMKFKSTQWEISQFLEHVKRVNDVEDLCDIDSEYGYYLVQDTNGKVEKKYFKPFVSNIAYIREEYDTYKMGWNYRAVASDRKMKINAKMFQDDAENIIEVKIPSGVQVIEHETFSKCKNLSVVKFNEGLEEIRASAFENTQLEELYLPHTLKSIDDDAFNGCKKLEMINFAEGLNYIHNNAFSNTAVESLDLPQSLFYIGKNAFEDCKNLRYLSMQYGLRTIEKGAFMGCEKLKAVVIPDSVSFLAHQVFSKCYGLKYVSLPKNLTTLPFAFENCTNLQFVKLPLNIDGYRYGVFPKCENLIVDGNLPKDDDAFKKCQSVTFLNDILKQNDLSK